jgi:putative Mn2+ efflux pump MntP
MVDDPKPPGIEGLKAANTLTGQVITIAAGLVAFTVTFAEKFTPKDKPVSLPATLKFSWVCFALTILVGCWTLMALLQIDRGGAETNPTRSNIRIPAAIMFALFFLGVLSLMQAGCSIHTP